MPSQFIVTVTPELQKSALRELSDLAPGVRKTREFKNGVFLIEVDAPSQEFTQALVQADPIFVKHIMPVHAEMKVTSARDVDLPAVLEKAQIVCPLAAGEEYAVQCRRIGLGYDYDTKDVEVLVGSHFESMGAIPRFSDLKIAADPSLKVISIYLFEEAGYIGFSTARDNLNEHCDEYRVFSRHPRDVSRAEFKLIEAMRKFGLAVPQGRALDLGAAPGGWTKVLADAGMQVVAVDPAELNEKVLALPNVIHAKMRAEDYLDDAGFDLLVNDMNIEPEASARLTAKMGSHLRPGAYALMTAKLVIRDPARLLGNMIPLLEPVYDIVRVKNLFHNRLELTLMLRRKGREGSAA